MGELQRSAPMAYLQVLVPTDASEDFAHQLGKFGCMMITDLNPHMQNINRPYMKDIIRLQEIERGVSEIEGFLEDEGIFREDDIAESDLQHIQRKNHRIEDIESEVYKSHRELKEQINILNTLNAQYTNNMNAAEVCRASKMFLAKEIPGVVSQANIRGRRDASSSYQDPESGAGYSAVPSADAGVGFKHIAGIVHTSQRVAFQRQVFLVTRGNSYVLFDDVAGDEEMEAFMVFYLGDRMKSQLQRLCEFMDITISVSSEDETTETLDQRRRQLEQESEQTRNIINQTKRNLNVLMRTVNVKLKRWKITLMQEKSIRVILNKFQVRDAGLECQGWCAVMNIGKVNEAMEVALAGKGGGNGIVEEIVPPKKLVPPTFFETNKFTSAFQTVVDTYGVPRYREYNPTVPTIITFPFLFSMMYGDMFHGSFVTLIALYFIVNEKKFEGKKLNELYTWLYGGRYLMVLMGIFAVYNGFVYNDCTSISLTLWSDSHYTEDESTKTGTFDGVYPFGIDPTWHGKTNMILFTNSLKMKLSVLFGVTQMSFGLVLCLLNHIEFKDWVSLALEWSFQVVFMLSFFVYMCVIIIYKWTVNWKSDNPGFAPPSLITVLVNMVLSFGDVEKDKTQLYDMDLQVTIQCIGAACMLLSIPLMLCCKPLALWCKYGGKKHHEEEYENLVEAEEADVKEDAEPKAVAKKEAEHEGGGGHGHDYAEHFDFGEVMIHQMIHTIEYVLGTISNTASYLRLWALSLAHSQLSEVFFQKTLQEMMTSSGITLFAGTTAFYAVTFGVLIVMDQLECFLHALRLHWVEFQNKFYNADGIEFTPFSYKALAKAARNAD